MIWIGPAARAALPAQMANYALWFLTLRWVLLDQRNRCPDVPAPAHRTGPNRRTVADVPRMVRQRVGVRLRPWTTADFRDAGQLLRGAMWHRLDGSWSGLFSPAAEARQR